VSEEARKYVKVVLTGEGADELMAGYDWWYAPLLDMEREPHPGALRRVILRIAAAAERRLRLGNRAARRLRGIDLRNRHDRVGAAHSHLRQICSDDDLAAVELPVPSRGFLGHAPGTLDDALRADIETYLPGEILVKADRASMAHGLELRAPFLDVDVASLLASLPSSLKLTNNESKAVLRRAYSRDWPESVRRRGKQGFGAPVARWLEDPAVRMLLSRCVDDPASPLHQVLPTAGIRRLRSAGSAPSWSLLVLGLWLERHEGHDTAPAHSA